VRSQEEAANESSVSWGAEEWRGLYARALFLVQDHDVAEDLVQETLLRAIVASPHCEDATKRRAWLVAVLRNLFIDRCRARRAMARAEREVSSMETSATPAATTVDVLDVLSACDLEEACRTLCKPDGELLKQVYFQQRSHKEVAADAGVKTATVGTRLFRVKGRLRRVLQPLVESRVATQAGRGWFA